MPDPIPPSRQRRRRALITPWGQLQRIGAVALVALSSGFFAWRCATSPEIPYVDRSPQAPWIMAPRPVSARLEQWGRAEAPRVAFERRVVLAEPAPDATLVLRALRGYRVLVNGAPLPGGSDDGARWRTPRRVPLGAALRPGENTLRVEIAHRHGPALLSLRSQGLPEEIVSDDSWQVERDGVPLGAAVPADDTRRNPAALTVETPTQAAAAMAGVLLLFFAAGAGGFAVWRRRATPRLQAALPAALLAVAAVLWALLFLDKFVRIPVEIGFDARHHVFYVDWLRARHSVPLATDGWSVYHPPFFYTLAALLEWLGEALLGRRGGSVGLKLLPFLAGLANVWVAAALCRRLFGDDPLRRGVAVLFAAVLPMNLYAAAYFSNETATALLAGLALLVTVDLLEAPRAGPRSLLLLSLLLGAALLTKFTAILVAAICLFFLLAKLLAIEHAPPARVLRAAALATLPALLVAGWFYARNVWIFGDPLLANWGDLPGPTQKWWQQPGFHTAAYYLHFGESLEHPYLSAFRSFWDSLYSTLWGDGGIAGRVDPAARHDFWHYGFMSSAYLMALPATLLVAGGAVSCAARALAAAGDPGRRAAFSLVATLAYTVLFGLLYMSLRLPYFAQAKATYGLVVMPALTLFFADGFARCDSWLGARGGGFLRAPLYGWLATFAATCFLAFAG